MSVSSGVAVSAAIPPSVVGAAPAPTGVPPPPPMPPLAARFPSASGGGLPQPVRIPPPGALLPPSGVPPLAGAISLSAPGPAVGPLSQPLGIPSVPVGGPPFDTIPGAVGISGGPSSAANSRLPPPRLFNLSVPPPPALTPPVSSMTKMLGARPAEDMDLDNSGSSEDDLGEGFDEEWPICSRRTSSRSRESDRQLGRDRGPSRLSELQTPVNSYHSTEPHSMLGNQPVESGSHFGMGFEQPLNSQMYVTSLPVSGSNFAISSASLDHNNPLPGMLTSMPPLGGPGMMVRGPVPLIRPPAEMTRVPGPVNPAGDSLMGGPSDVDLRISSYGGGIQVPVGPPPLSASTRLAPPPIPSMTRPPISSQHFPGALRPPTDSSLPVPSDGIGAGEFNGQAAGMDTAHSMLGPKLGGVGMPGNSPPGLPRFQNIARPSMPVSSSASIHDTVRGPYDVGSRFINLAPSSTLEPVNPRPPGQQTFMQGTMTANPGMMSAGRDISPVTGRGPMFGSRLVGPGNVNLPGNIAALGPLPMNAGNVGPLRCPSDFSGVTHSTVSPDLLGFNIRHEMPRLRGPESGSFLPGVNNSDRQHSTPQIPSLLGAPPSGVPIEPESSLSKGPSERVLNALQSLAGMQTDTSQDLSAHDGRGLANPRFDSVDAAMQPMASGLKKGLFGPPPGFDVCGFGSSVPASLLPQQGRTDGFGPGLPFASLPAPPRFSSGQPRFPLPGN